MKLYEPDKYGNIVPIPEDQEPKDRRWTVRAPFIHLMLVVLVIVFLVSWLE